MALSSVEFLVLVSKVAQPKTRHWLLPMYRRTGVVTFEAGRVVLAINYDLFLLNNEHLHRRYSGGVVCTFYEYDL